MSLIPVGRLAPGDQWDTHLLDLLIDGQLWPHGLNVRRYTGFPNAGGCCLIVPGRYWHTRVDDINEAIGRYKWLLLMITSDEESLFDYRDIVHPRVKFWVQTPRTDRDYGDARLFGVGYTSHFTDLPAEAPEAPDKPLDVYLSGQDTHQRRHECFAALTHLPEHTTRDITATDGFTQGTNPDHYTQQMTAAKVAPCPAGPASPDTFRVWEALEAHTIPIADDLTPGYDSAGYWQMLFPDAPFPILTNYGSLPGYIAEALKGWPTNANRIAAWWMRQKRAMALNLREDLAALGAL